MTATAAAAAAADDDDDDTLLMTLLLFDWSSRYHNVDNVTDNRVDCLAL